MVKSNGAKGKLSEKISPILFVLTTFTLLGRFNIFLLKFDESVILMSKFCYLCNYLKINFDNLLSDRFYNLIIF
jgi:hypothetical protein